ncbi:hypothetical protein M0804_002044 [Polistes exclamans]|nr:hypothetical protein M0804_002044 [Polistes exclamans]
MPVAWRFPPHESAVAVGVIHPFGCTWIRYLAAAAATATTTGSNVASKSNDIASPSVQPSVQPGLTGSGRNEK